MHCRFICISTVIHNCQKLCFLAHLVTSTPSDSFGEVPRDQCCNLTKRGGSLPGDRPPGVEAGTYRGPDVMLACCLKLKQRNPVSRVTVCWNVFEYVPWCFTKIDTDSHCSLCFFRRILPRPGSRKKSSSKTYSFDLDVGFSFDLNEDPCLYVVQYLSWSAAPNPCANLVLDMRFLLNLHHYLYDELHKERTMHDHLT